MWDFSSDAVFNRSVYRGNYRLLMAETTNGTAFAPVLAVAHSTIVSALQVANNLVNGVLTHANGYLPMGAGDGLELMFGGTDASNEAFNYTVVGYVPIFNAGEPHVAQNPPAPKAWAEVMLASGLVTLGAATAGAAGALVSGIDSGDLIGDTITDTISMPGTKIINGSDTPARVAINGTYGVQVARVHLDLTTAASAWCLARRIKGEAQNW